MESITKTVPNTLGWLYGIERYETEYGIFDHDKTDDSLAVMLMHEAENPLAFSMTTRRMVEYFDKEIEKFYGLSYTDWLRLPRNVLEESIRLVDKRQAELNRIRENDLRRLEEENKRLR
mgnify:FL=1